MNCKFRPRCSVLVCVGAGVHRQFPTNTYEQEHWQTSFKVTDHPSAIKVVSKYSSDQDRCGDESSGALSGSMQGHE